MKFEAGEVLLSPPLSLHGHHTGEEAASARLVERGPQQEVPRVHRLRLTSNLENRANSVLLEPSEMVEGSLPLRSRVKRDKVFTLEKSLGRISPGKFEQVKKGLISLQG